MFLWRNKKNYPKIITKYSFLGIPLNKNSLTSRDSDQPVHPANMARVFVYLLMDSLEAVEGTYDQLRL